MNLTHETTPDNSKFCGEEISSGCQDDRWGPNPPFVHNSVRLPPNGAPLARTDVELRGPSQTLTSDLIKYRYKYKDIVHKFVFVNHLLYKKQNVWLCLLIL